MAKYYGNYNAARGANPPGNADGTYQGGRERILSNVFDLSKLAALVGIADVLVLGTLPKGASPRGGIMTVDTTMATSTIAIGTATVPAKYKAAAVATTVNTPAAFGAITAGAYDPLAADEEVILTIAVAALPAAGKLYVDMKYIAP